MWQIYLTYHQRMGILGHPAALWAVYGHFSLRDIEQNSTRDHPPPMTKVIVFPTFSTFPLDFKTRIAQRQEAQIKKKEAEKVLAQIRQQQSRLELPGANWQSHQESSQG